ncbi:hypothetical protein CALCODRAFT_457068 [Calocera cornea HHB12733]|uniref:NACHT domain-containing protein n=2 Tax=Calocera cornea HHB12733 TaxID=1353952 RepID=A0A165E5V4_9BASI|nr:hypothetical protein CALCODRAFT_457068 [Calocera cornea HHB12733]
MSVDESTLSKATKCTYVLSGAIVGGLPNRALWKTKARYFIILSIDGDEVWRSGEMQTKGSHIVWDRVEDGFPFACGLASAVRVTLLKNHSSRPVEEVGVTALPLSSWLKATAAVPLTKEHGPKHNHLVGIKLNILYAGDDKLAVVKDDSIRQVIEQATTAVSELELSPGLAISAAVDPVTQLQNGLQDVSPSWKAFLDSVQWFVNAMDSVTEVHPYAKMAWSVLSGAYKVVKAQQDRDANVLDLVEKMRNVYSFLQEAQEVMNIAEAPGNDPLRESALRRLASQTVECAHFITTYSRNKRFFSRLIGESIGAARATVTKYSSSFDMIKQDFRDGSQLCLEIFSIRMLADVSRMVQDLDIRDIPYVNEAGFELGKRCLPGTRTALLDEIEEWVNADAPATPRIFLLMGRAGTGKSTLAHTIASRFHNTDQLGSTFCFSANEASTRTPASLFRNIARDLCKGRQAFKFALSQSIGDDSNACGTKDLEMQFEKFILGPAKRLVVNGTILVIVDALDESATAKDRAKLLWLLRHRLKELPPSFRFFITSREEMDIAEAFLPGTAEAVVKRMPTLEDDGQLSADILKYVRHSLSKDDSDELLPGLSDESCSILTDKSEGIFQWAVVACSYIKERRPGESLARRYNLLISRDDVTLDSLYRTILQQVLDPNSKEHDQDSAEQTAQALDYFKIIMGIILVAVEPLSMQSLNALASYAQSDDSFEVYGLVRPLGSLLSGVGEGTQPLRPLHSSFSDLLQDPKRGGVYYIGSDGHHERVLTASLRLLQRRLKFNMGEMESSYVSNSQLAISGSITDNLPASLVYACKHWGHHLFRSVEGFEQHNPEVGDLIRRLFMEKLLFWLEAASLGGVVPEVLDDLVRSMSRLKVMGDKLHTLAVETMQFITDYEPAITVSAAHVYMSALIWLPTTSQIAQIYRPMYPRLAQPILSSEAASSAVDALRSRQLAEVLSVALSPDGKRFVSGSSDNAVQFWDIASRAPVGLPLTGHSDWVHSVAFSPDGQHVVSGSADKTVRVWDARTGQLTLGPLTGHTYEVTAVAFSPDGRSILSGSLDGTVRMWDANNGEPVPGMVLSHPGRVHSAAFSRDGSRIAAGYEKNIRLWNAITAQPIGDPLTGHQSSVTSVAFSPNGKQIVSGSGDKTLRLWDVATQQAIFPPLEGHSSWINSVAFFPDGARVVSGSLDGTLRVWDARTGRGLGEPLMGHQQEVNAVVVSGDGRRIVSCSGSKSIQFWETEEDGAEDMPGERGEGERSVASRRVPPLSRENNNIRVWDAHAIGILLEDSSKIAESIGACDPGTPHAATDRPRLSLSPNSRHQLAQPYSPSSPASTGLGIMFDLDTGWVMGNGKDHILWVPPEQLRQLYTGQCEVVIPGPMVYIDLSRFVHGTRWTECRSSS